MWIGVDFDVLILVFGEVLVKVIEFEVCYEVDVVFDEFDVEEVLFDVEV